MRALGFLHIVAVGAAGLLGGVAGAGAADVSIGVGVGGYGHHGGYYGPHRYYGPRYYGPSRYYGPYHRSPYYYGGSSVMVVPRTRVVPVEPRVYGGSQVVRDVQAELRRRHYYNGSIDGIFGPRTREALTAYQSRRGLRVTGAIDGPTLDALGLD